MEEEGSTSSLMKWRLSAMMALTYAGQGAWWPLLAVYLNQAGCTGRDRALVFGALPIALMIAPLGVGQIADRFWPIQRCLAVGFGGAGLLLALVCWLQPTDPTVIGPLLFAYWLVGGPAANLTNAMAFRNLRDPAREYTSIRVWGTIGWMVAGWGMAAFLALSDQPIGELAFGVGAGLTLLQAGYCLTLPHTPPRSVQVEGARASDMLGLLRDRQVLAYFGVAFGVSLCVPFMYQVVPPYLGSRGISRGQIMAAMSLGQILEIILLFAMPRLLTRWGYRPIMALGVVSWAIRFGVLTVTPPVWLAIAAMPLQGSAVACFTIAGQMFLDSRAPGHRRASAQAINLTTTSGLGALSGSLLGGEAFDRSGGSYAVTFLVPTLIALATLVALMLAFRPERASSTSIAGWPLADEPRGASDRSRSAGRRPDSSRPRGPAKSSASART